ncbi:MAG: DUF4282 domain-containing protein [Gemmatimonadetes bacterium]|nr:DUF4282 domain-containing protein [Gemmatimonadota bacterium]
MTTQDTGFLGSLFDFSFSNFITARLIKVLYALGLVVAGLCVMVMLTTAFGYGFMFGLLALLVAPILFLFIAMYMRVIMEVLIVVFRISENVARIADKP